MGKIINGVLGLTALSVCAFSFLPLIETYAWWVRMADFPRLQFAIALIVLLVGIAPFLKARPKSTITVLVIMQAALIYHGVVLFPYLPKGLDSLPDHCPRDKRLSILVANVRLSSEPSGKIVKTVQREKPDLFLAMETDEHWDKALATLSASMPYSIQQVTGSYFGIHLFSRLPLISPAIRFFAAQEIPQIVTGVRLRNGEIIDFLGLHPRPPHPSQSALSRDAVLQKAGFIVRDSQRLVVVGGDFNATPWESATALMQRVGRLIDPREGYGYLPTYNAKSWWMAWPIDHIFYQTGFSTITLQRLEAFGSDHYPYQAELCRLGTEKGQPPPNAEPEDIQKAHRIIELARQKADGQTEGHY